MGKNYARGGPTTTPTGPARSNPPRPRRTDARPHAPSPTRLEKYQRKESEHELPRTYAGRRRPARWRQSDDRLARPQQPRLPVRQNQALRGGRHRGPGIPPQLAGARPARQEHPDRRIDRSRRLPPLFRRARRRGRKRPGRRRVPHPDLQLDGTGRPRARIPVLARRQPRGRHHLRRTQRRPGRVRHDPHAPGHHRPRAEPVDPERALRERGGGRDGHARAPGRGVPPPAASDVPFGAAQPARGRLPRRGRAGRPGGARHHRSLRHADPAALRDGAGQPRPGARRRPHRRHLRHGRPGRRGGPGVGAHPGPIGAPRPVRHRFRRHRIHAPRPASPGDDPPADRADRPRRRRHPPGADGGRGQAPHQRGRGASRPNARVSGNADPGAVAEPVRTLAAGHPPALARLAIRCCEGRADRLFTYGWVIGLRIG